MASSDNSAVEPNLRVVNSELSTYRRLSLWLGVLVASVGAGHLAAWLTGTMAQYGLSSITMKTNSALGIFLSGGTLALIAAGKTPPRGVWRWLGAAAAVVVLAIGTLTLIEHLGGWNLGIDQLLASEPAGAQGTVSPNRPGLPGSTCLTLASLALLLLITRRRIYLAQFLAILICVLGLLSVVGYLYNVRGLYALAQLTAIAWPTAGAFLLLGVGLLCCEPELGFMRQVTAPDAGGATLRWLALPTVVLLILLGWARLAGERLGWYETALGTSLLVLVFSLVFSVFVYSTARSLSRLTESEREAQRVLRRQARLIDVTPAATIVRTIDGTVQFWSDGAVRLYGYSRSEALGQRTQDLLHTRFPQPLDQIVAEIRRNGQWSGELQQQTKDGRELAVQSWWSAQFSPDGTVVELLESNVDITDRRRAEEALKESEQRYRSFVEASAQVIWRTNREGAVDQPIPSWNAFTGQSEKEAMGFGWMTAIHEADQPRVVEAWRVASAARALYQVEYRLKRHDGRWRMILARGVPVLEPEGEVREYIGTCIDVTEQRQAESAVQRQARLIDLAPAATLVRDMAGVISFWSDGAERLYGWTRQEAFGQTSHELLSTELPEPMEKILETLRQHGSWSGELAQMGKHGQRLIVESHWLGQFASEGELVEVLESNMDVTERKQAIDELRRLKEELEHRVKERTTQLAAANKELEAFTYSVSHDLRAPLRHLISYLGMLGSSVRPKLNETEDRYMTILKDAAKRMGGLMDDLLALSRIGRATMNVRTVELRRVLDEALHELGPAMEDRQIEWRIHDLPSVQGDPNLLRSAFTNLVGNAIKYTRNRKPSVIEIGTIQADGEVVCFVRDNGAGFDMKFKDKLFGAFQRLHSTEEFEGSGVGLASVRRVIQRHGGRTWAEGEPGKGAAFYFTLPIEPRTPFIDADL